MDSICTDLMLDSSKMPRNNKNPLLPLMPFGQARAKVHSDVRAFTDAVSSVVDHAFYVDAAGADQAFYHAAASVNINDTHLVASVSTPIRYQVGESDRIYLMVPFHGSASALVADYHSPFEQVRDVFLSPNTQRHGESSTLAMLQTMLNPERLTHIARTMLGEPAAQKVHSQLDQPQVLDFRQGLIRYDHLFKRICQIIDDLQLDETLLALHGVDDSLYRTVVMMLLPELCLEGSGGISTSRPEPIDSVCDFVRSNLEYSITLTQLEEVSRMTARSLRYAFQKRFDCSPMQWVTQQRLELAYQKLTMASPADTVTSIAYACGITRLGMFAQDYFRRFGERPSATLARALGR